MEQLTVREYEILKILLMAKAPASIRTMADVLGVSDRTVRYDLKKLEYLLKQKGVTLTTQKNAGVSISDPVLAMGQFNLDFSTQDEVSWQILSKEERVRKIVSLLLRSGDTWTIEDLSNEMEVSRSTTVNDLNDVEHWFLAHGIQLVRRTGLGLWLRCEERQLRRGIAAFIQENISSRYTLKEIICDSVYGREVSRKDIFIRNHILSLVDETELRHFQDCISRVESSMGVTYSDDAAFYLVLHLGIMKNRLRQKKTLTVSPEYMDTLRGKSEFTALSCLRPELEDALKLTIPENEFGDLALAFAGASKSKADPNLSERIGRYAKRERRAAKAYLDAVGAQLGLNLTRDPVLMGQMLSTLTPMLYRIKNGIRTANPSLEDIKQRYPGVFNAAWDAVSVLGRELNLELGEAEVGLLAMCICSYVEGLRSRTRRTYRVLVACGSGVGTASLLSSRLINEFDNISIVDMVTIRELEHYQFVDVDFVVSTVPVRNILIRPIICVSPLLKDADVEQIRHAQRRITTGRDSPHGCISISRIIDVVSQSCTIHDKDSLRRALVQEYSKDKPTLFGGEENIKMLEDMVSLNRIKVKVPARSKEEVIRTAGQLLLEDDCVEEGYIGAMLQMAEQFNSYIVIMPGVAMPHARPEAGAKEAAFAIMTLERPLPFGHPQNDPIHLVVALSAPDKTSHLMAVRNLSKLLCDEEKLQQLFNADDPQTIYDTVVAFERSLTH